MKMIIDPVIVDIQDNWKYGEVVYLVDRDDFLNDLIYVRKKLQIPQNIKQYDKKTNNLEILSKQDQFYSKLLDSANRLRMKYKKPMMYCGILEEVILTNYVSNEIIRDTAYCNIVTPKSYHQQYLKGVNEPELAIFITPLTKIKEIEEIYRKDVPYYITLLNKYFLKSKRKIQDTVSHIKRDRKWYWMHKQGLSYQKIKNTENSGITRDGIIKAIKQYSKRLSMEI